ncbi:hypothetical protein ACQ9Y2_21305 [Pseudomonas palleroniana]
MSISRTLFLDMKDWVIFSDSTSFLKHCDQNNLLTNNIMNADSQAKNSIVFSFSDSAAKKTFELAKLTAKKRCIFCPLHVFEASISNASYSLECLLKSDIAQALADQRKALELINCKIPLSLFGPMTKATIKTTNNAIPYAILEEDLQGDFVHSVAEFFEVHFAHMDTQEPCPFSVEGEFRVSGVLAVLRKAESATPLIKNSLNVLIGEVASKQALLKVNANTITSFKVGDIEYLDLVRRAAGPRGVNLTEFAIGVNRSISPLIDFSINSQMNEGISGVHVAVGDGTTGYHIDFLCPDVVAQPS